MQLLDWVVIGLSIYLRCFFLQLGWAGVNALEPTIS